MTGSAGNSTQQDKFAQANPNPVLSSSVDGVLQFINPATVKLTSDLELEKAEDLLPKDHRGLVLACHKTGITLTGESQLDGHNIVWSYRSIDESDIVYIYGHDVTTYKSRASNITRLPENNPNPVLVYGLDGLVLFKNNAVDLLLDDLDLEEVEEVLPVDHNNIVKSCSKSDLTVTDERQRGARGIVWSYQLSDNGDAVNIYGFIVTDYQPKNLRISGLPETNPSPVLTSGLDGETGYMNHAATELLRELQLDSVEEMLPSEHKGMAKACHLTSTPLSLQHQVSGKTFAWSYHPIEGHDVVYIYGHDISEYCSDVAGKS